MVAALLLPSLRPVAPQGRAWVLAVEAEDRSFWRAADIFQVGPRVSTREVVNVLGRFEAHREWNDGGGAAALEQPRFARMSRAELLRDREWVALQNDDDPRRTPQRRSMLRSRGQAERVWFVENVPKLRFRDARLAASVGATVSQLNSEPVSEAALETVFDAITLSKSSIVGKERADEARKSYQRSDGSFDSTAFAADLSTARSNIIVAALVFPGSIVIFQALLVWRLATPDNIKAGSEVAGMAWSRLQVEWGESGPVALVLPVATAAVLKFGPSSRIGKPLGGGRPPNV